MGAGGACQPRTLPLFSYCVDETGQLASCPDLRAAKNLHI